MKETLTAIKKKIPVVLTITKQKAPIALNKVRHHVHLIHQLEHIFTVGVCTAVAFEAHVIEILASSGLAVVLLVLLVADQEA